MVFNSRKIVIRNRTKETDNRVIKALLEDFNGDSVTMLEFGSILSRRAKGREEVMETALLRSGLVSYGIKWGDSVFTQESIRPIVYSLSKDSRSLEEAVRLADTLVYVEQSIDNLQVYEDVMNVVLGDESKASAATNFKIGMINSRKGNYKSAERLIKSSMQLDPENASTYHHALAHNALARYNSTKDTKYLAQAQDETRIAQILDPHNELLDDLSKKLRDDKPVIGFRPPLRRSESRPE
ncbi:hypothetical protein J4216_06495 [Candidatus Woesearchaeota archaeon]|nr:hypothetical protein [Candidatus Woesearchaeota archaeon]